MIQGVLAAVCLVVIAFFASFLLTGSAAISLCVTAVTLAFQLSTFWVLSHAQVVQATKR